MRQGELQAELQAADTDEERQDIQDGLGQLQLSQFAIDANTEVPSGLAGVLTTGSADETVLSAFMRDAGIDVTQFSAAYVQSSLNQTGIERIRMLVDRRRTGPAWSTQPVD